MKKHMILRATALMMTLLMIAAVFTACGEPIKLTIIDAGTKTEVEAAVGTKVEDVLKEAKITLGPKDECEPKADAEITEETTTITIKRYAKVTVVNGDESVTVELVGGTVEEALKKANVNLADNQSVDVDLKAYLKDGMTITVVSKLTVSLTADGKTTEVSTSAATVQALLDEQGIKLGEDDEISEKADAKLTDGMKIVVKRVTYKEETKTETVDYSFEEDYDSSMEEGTSKVTQSGVEGEKTVTYKVKYVDGKEADREVISEKVTKEPVNQITTYGTASSGVKPKH